MIVSRIDELFSLAPLPYNHIYVPTPYEDAAKVVKNHSFYPYNTLTDVNKEAYQRGGFNISQKYQNVNVISGKLLPDEDFLKIQVWQKYNHFFNADLIGRKDEFHRRIKELRKRIGDKETSFYCQTYLLPEDNTKIYPAWSTAPYWIVKPRASSKAQNIEVRSSKNKSFPPYPSIIQRYIERPMLITGRKFDIRFYVMVTSISPLVFYIHRQGLGLFATSKFDPDGSPDDKQMHITNWEINKDSPNFIRPNGIDEHVEDSKWSLPFFFNYLGDKADLIKDRMESATIKAIIAGLSKMRDPHLSTVKGRHTSFELLGVDLLLDADENPYVIEVNVSPGMQGTDSELDKHMKLELMMDTINLARIVDCDPLLPEPCPEVEKIEAYEKASVSAERRESVLNGSVNPWESPTFLDMEIVRDFIEEQKSARYYHLAFPKEDFQKYQKCFDPSYEDIVLWSWINMPERERIEVINANIEKHANEIKVALQTPLQRNFCSIA